MSVRLFPLEKRHFLIRDLAFTPILFSILLLFSACSMRLNTGFSKAYSDKAERFEVFGQDFGKVLYKTSIDVYGNHLSGLMFIKNLPADSAYRVVFLSELGMKFFDFEFPKTSEGSFKVHYCMAMLNKKMIMKTLQKDLELLLMTGFEGAKQKLKEEDSGKYRIRKYKKGSERRLYFKEISSGNISKIERNGRLFNKVEVELSDYQDNAPSRIKIKHSNMKLYLELSKVKAIE
ncbi:MAG: hypothetical protein K9H64_21685 [Bacteroidales bacterium]|nr:hypothetical protein [Bacteroidales bacterium]MCF8458646.1 hypothetical protein [Bacteroidales bacterium]